MRFSAVIPIVFGLVAFVLSMLCIFAGSRSGFIEDYAIVTLNTSRIGESVLNSTTKSSSSSVLSWIYSVESSVKSDIDNDIGSYARSLGLHDFYSFHILDYCEGDYTPTSVPNATIPLSSIHETNTTCSNRTSFFNFNPTAILSRELNKSGTSVNLTDLHWPSAIEDGLSALHIAQDAAFVLYCIAAGLLGTAALASIVAAFLTGRLSACVDILLAVLAFLAILIASAITTTVALKIVEEVKAHGGSVRISARKGEKFLILTWVATGLAFLNIIVWMVECVVGRRRKVVRSEESVVEK